MNTKTGTLGIPILHPQPDFGRWQGKMESYELFSRYAENSEIGKTATARFASDPRVRALEGRMISNGSGASMWALQHFIYWYLWTWNERGQALADEQAGRFLETGKIETLVCWFVLGPVIQESILLADGIQITPIRDLPHCDSKVRFSGFSLDISPVPNCAFTRPVVVPHVSKESFLESEIRDVQNRLYRLIMLMNAIPGIHAVPYEQTSIPINSPFGPFGGSGSSIPMFDLICQNSCHLTPNECKEIGSLDAALSKRDEGRRAQLMRSLKRLMDSKSRTSLDDKFLDLCIALEMLVLDDNKTNDQLRQSFALRAAWILASTIEERRDLFLRFRRLYDLRSAVAHTGQIDRKKHQPEELQAFYKTIAADACRIVQVLILREKPDWQSLVLGAP